MALRYADIAPVVVRETKHETKRETKPASTETKLSPTETKPNKVGRPKMYATAADRLRAFRERKKLAGS